MKLYDGERNLVLLVSCAVQSISLHSLQFHFCADDHHDFNRSMPHQTMKLALGKSYRQWVSVNPD